MTIFKCNGYTETKKKFLGGEVINYAFTIGRLYQVVYQANTYVSHAYFLIKDDRNKQKWILEESFLKMFELVNPDEMEK